MVPSSCQLIPLALLVDSCEDFINVISGVSDGPDVGRRLTRAPVLGLADTPVTAPGWHQTSNTLQSPPNRPWNSPSSAIDEAKEMAGSYRRTAQEIRQNLPLCS
ncbi:hypothetical protein RRG08_022964 [Elysia crispata]|uniref:Uncharacterized protein n=1 Tax=Elysia crispata TaxID=231223 RepID=A0AAE1AFX7_9GAST|nr:hypothetical protein RRG08_022964 [Elysia crispata]